jgi:hypothetical protein
MQSRRKPALGGIVAQLFHPYADTAARIVLFALTAPTTKAADAPPRTHPYWKRPRDAARSSRRQSARWRQRRSVRDAHKEEDRKCGRKKIAQRDDSGHGEEHGKDTHVLAEPISEARNGWPGDQSDSGFRGQHRADLRGAKPAFMKKRGQERGRDPKGREQRAVEK